MAISFWPTAKRAPLNTGNRRCKPAPVIPIIPSNKTATYFRHHENAHPRHRRPRYRPHRLRIREDAAAMTPDDKDRMNRAIALFMGYAPIPGAHEGDTTFKGWMTKPGAASWDQIERIPDYTGDLNAIHAAYMHLKKTDGIAFSRCIIRLATCDDAEHRAEVFCLVTGCYPATGGEKA